MRFHKVRETIVTACFSDILEDERFILLYDIKAPRNPDFQYENYRDRFDLDNLNDNKRNSYFRQEAATGSSLLQGSCNVSCPLMILPAKEREGHKNKKA